MAVLEWDRVAERLYEAGLDRGVLFLADGRAVPWNGLIAIEERTPREVQEYYIDGVKYLQTLILGDFAANLRAFTYPDEFDEVNGVVAVVEGLSYHDQPPKSFNLVYRTRIGNDVDGLDHGYRIHILYNVMVVPEQLMFQTLGEEVSPNEFSWNLAATPSMTAGRRPTAHISIDSRETDPLRLEAIERTLYGSETSDPLLPPLSEFTTFFEQYNALTIIDNGDGTFTAIDPADQYITMLDSETFEITADGAEPIDADTYFLSTTTPE